MLSEQSGIQVDKFYPPTDWQYSFPEGYTRLDYLTFTNAQYIELNFKANQDTRVITEVSFSTVISDQAIFSSRDTKTTNTFSCILVGHKIRADYNTTRIQTVDPIINTYYKIDFNKNNFYINGNLETTFTYANFQSSYNMTIGVALVSGATPASYLRGNLKQTIIFDNGTLAFNLVPVKRNSDNKPGMYDLVNNVFYVNQGSGDDFIIGPALYTNKSQIDIRQKNNLNFGKNYEFNANDELTWANPNMYLTGKVNYTKVGNPTIVDNVASGFSSSNYIANNNIFDITSNFEIYVKINSWGNINSVQNFLSLRGNVNLNLRFDTTATNINAVYGSQSTQWNNIATNLSLGIPLYIKIKGDRINITITTLQNGISQSNSKTISELGLNGDYTIYFGRGGTSYPFTSGYIDLSQTYIKVNGQMWFYGKNYSTSNIAVVPAGLVYNNTTTPSIGYVNMQTQEFTPAPEGAVWKHQRDISVVPPEDNTITLLYGVASDFSAYSLFGLLAQVSSGTYDVYIDDVLYTTTASETQTDIDFSTLGSEYVSIGTCTTPEELVLHKIVIKPNTSGSTITRFACRRTTEATGIQLQGILWANFELQNSILMPNCFGSESAYNNKNLYAVTAKNNKIIVTSTSTNTTGIYSIYARCSSLLYSPIFEYDNKNNINGVYLSFDQTQLKKIIIKNNPSIDMSVVRNAQKLEKIEIENPVSLRSGTASGTSVQNAYNLKLLPKYETETRECQNINMYGETSLYPTKIDDNSNNIREFLRIYGTSTYPMRGLQGLKVSNEAPFSGTSPQINVAYTGLGRNELIELFNSMPDVTQATDGITRTINITAASGNNLTKIGSPTIDSNGIVSGFDSSNYLKTNNYITGTKNITIKIAFVKTQDDTNVRLITNNTLASRMIAINYSGSSLRGSVYINGTRYQVSSSVTILDNKKYYVIMERIGTKLYIKVSTDNINYTIDSMDIPNDVLDIQGTQVNIGGFDTSFFQGSIDLENTYIKVGSNYLMKGYLLDSDRAIVTNKGWSITG